jgi:hypothetical protein
VTSLVSTHADDEIVHGLPVNVKVPQGKWKCVESITQRSCTPPHYSYNVGSGAKQKEHSMSLFQVNDITEKGLCLGTLGS